MPPHPLRWPLPRASRAIAWSGLFWPAAAAFGVVILLFGAYEVVERSWLADAEPGALHFYHRLRGLVASLVAASVAGWLILRSSPPLFTADAASGTTRPIQATEQERTAHYARWFIRMRWIAVVAAAVLVFLAVRVLDYLPEHRWTPLALTVATLGALNVAYAAALRAGHATRGWLLAQAYGDLLVLTLLLHFSGGVENPLGVLMVFHVIIAGIVLTRHQCYGVAAVGSVLFGALAWGEWAGVLPHYTLTIFPHHPHGAETFHAAHDPEFALSRAGLQAVLLVLTAHFSSSVTTQLRRGELRLEQFADRVLAQSQPLERALETTGTALCVCDRELRPTWSNPRWQAIFREREGGCPTLAEAGRAPAVETLNDGRTRLVELELPPAHGGAAGCQPRTFVLATAPLVDKDGAITNVVQLAREVTEQRRLQANLLRAEKLAALGELAGKVAHEVNNPIAIVSAKARLLLTDRRAELTDHTAGELAKIVEFSDRVGRIARGLLTFGRPTGIRRTPLDIREPLLRALSAVEATASAGGITIERRLSDPLPPVRVDAGAMEQVFLNLYLNALDAMPAGGRLRIGARTLPEGAAAPGTVEVVLEDTGCGIPDEIRGRIFEPFLTTKPEGRGTGLGLSICLGLVQSNGGTIELESEPGLGTRAVLRFPVAADGPDPRTEVNLA